MQMQVDLFGFIVWKFFKTAENSKERTPPRISEPLLAFWKCQLNLFYNLIHIFVPPKAIEIKRGCPLTSSEWWHMMKNKIPS